MWLQSERELAPRWLSGGRDDVPLRDNPTAIVYVRFLERLSEIFIQADDPGESD